MWRFRYFEFAVFLLIAPLAFTGCRGSRGTASGTGRHAAEGASKHSKRDWLDVGWVTALGPHGDTLMVLRSIGGSYGPAGLLLNTKSGEIRQLKSLPYLHDVARNPVSGNVVISADKSRIPRPPGLGIWLYTPNTDKFRRVISLRDDTPMDLMWSPSGMMLAAWLYPGKDVERRDQWFLPPNNRRGPRPRTHPIPCVIDMKSGKVRRIDCLGYPMGWSADSKFLYIISDYGTIRFRVADGKIEKMSKYALASKVWALPGSQHYLGMLRYTSGRTRVFEMDGHLKILRVVGRIEGSEGGAMSPDRKHFAYRSDGHYWLFSMKDGRTRKLGDLKGNMGPTWIDNRTLAVANSSGYLWETSAASRDPDATPPSGTVSILSLDGSVRKTYRFKGI